VSGSGRRARLRRARIVRCNSGWLAFAVTSGVLACVVSERLVDWLLDHGVQVYSLNPRQLDRLGDRHTVSGAKDDSRDAFVLADALRTDLHKFSLMALPDPVQVAIRQASRRYDTLQTECHRSANRLWELMLQCAPGLLGLCPGADEAFFWRFIDPWERRVRDRCGQRLRAPGGTNR